MIPFFIVLICVYEVSGILLLLMTLSYIRLYVLKKATPKVSFWLYG